MKKMIKGYICDLYLTKKILRKKNKNVAKVLSLEWLVYIMKNINLTQKGNSSRLLAVAHPLSGRPKQRGAGGVKGCGSCSPRVCGRRQTPRPDMPPVLWQQVPREMRVRFLTRKVDLPGVLRRRILSDLHIPVDIGPRRRLGSYAPRIGERAVDMPQPRQAVVLCAD